MLKFPINWFGNVSRPKLNYLSQEILTKGFIKPNFIGDYKTIFLESNANLETLQKFLFSFKVSYKFVLKSDKKLNRIF